MAATLERTVTDTQAAKAAAVIERVKPKLSRLRGELEPAEEVMKTWFREHEGKTDFRGRIGYNATFQERLDTQKVKLDLGKRLSRFLRKVRVETLTVLKT